MKTPPYENPSYAILHVDNAGLHKMSFYKTGFLCDTLHFHHLGLLVEGHGVTISEGQCIITTHNEALLVRFATWTEQGFVKVCDVA